MIKDREKKYKKGTQQAFREAKDWFIRIKSVPLSPEERAQFRDWLNEHPSHKAEFDMASALWDRADVLNDHPLITKELIKDAQGEDRSQKRKWCYRFPVLKSAAVMLTAILVIGGIWFSQKDLPSKQVYQTATGVLKTIQLADGSTVNLDTDTLISATLSKDLRQIELEKGRALFSVAHDSSRPFVVSAGQYVIRALGTEFNVYKEQTGKVTVSVTQGRIEINQLANLPEPDAETVSESPVTTPESEQKIVTPQKIKKPGLAKAVIVSGQEIIADGPKTTYEIKSVDVENVKAWQRGRLYFHKTPLEDVVREVNRYLDRKIVIGDDRLKDLHITMNFLLAHRSAFAQALEKAIPITSQQNADSQIILLKYL